MTKEIIIDGVDVSEWPDEEVRYKFEKHSPKAIRQIAFDLYKQLKSKNIKIFKTLTKIKEIAEKQVKRAPDGETFARPEIKQILQKISECEVE